MSKKIHNLFVELPNCLHPSMHSAGYTLLRNNTSAQEEQSKNQTAYFKITRSFDIVTASCQIEYFWLLSKERFVQCHCIIINSDYILAQPWEGGILCVCECVSVGVCVCVYYVHLIFVSINSICCNKVIKTIESIFMLLYKCFLLYWKKASDNHLL